MEKNTLSEVFNVWGPTETSIVNSMYKIQKKDIKNLQLGRNQPGENQKEMELTLLKIEKS